MTLKEKYNDLTDFIGNLESCVVAFSGGVDSSLVAKAAFDALGGNAVAVTVKSAALPDSELSCARKVAGEIGIKHVVAGRDVLKSKAFTGNPENRCYLCKKEVIGILREIADEHKIKFIIDGTNSDDLKDPGRTGIRALKEGGVLSPLAEVGLNKSDVRKLLKKFRISNYKKPSFSCLATRISFGEKITPEKLKRIESAEEFIKNSGARQVRVRMHDDIARIEVPDSDFSRIVKNRKIIAVQFKSLGFNYITLDIEGRKIKN